MGPHRGPKKVISMPKIHLGRDSVAHLQSPERGRLIYWDDMLRGFGLQVGPKTKSFVVQKNGGGRRTLGHFPELSVKQARTEAMNALGEIARRGKVDAVVTLRGALENYVAGLMQAGRSPTYVAATRYNVERYLAEWLGRSLHALTPRMVQQQHAEIGKRGPWQANKVMRSLRAIYNAARRLDRELPPNPVTAALTGRWFPERERTDIVDDLAAWYRDVRAMPNPVRRCLQEFVLLTGLRSTDARTIRWEDVDFQERTLHRPMPKGGEHRNFTIPVSCRAMAILRYLRMYNVHAWHGSPWVFTTQDIHGRITHVQEPKEQHREKGKWVRKLPNLHMLRHTYISVAIAAGVPEFDISVLVNHRIPRNSMTRKYVGAQRILARRLAASQEQITRALREEMKAGGEKVRGVA